MENQREFMQSELKILEGNSAGLVVKGLSDNEKIDNLNLQLQQLVMHFSSPVFEDRVKDDPEGFCTEILDELAINHLAQILDTQNDMEKGKELIYRVKFAISNIKIAAFSILKHNSTLVRTEALYKFIVNNIDTDSNTVRLYSNNEAKYHLVLTISTYMTNPHVKDQTILDFILLLLDKNIHNLKTGYMQKDFIQVLSAITDLRREKEIAAWLVDKVKQCSKKDKQTLIIQIMGLNFREYATVVDETYLDRINIIRARSYLIHVSCVFLAVYLKKLDLTDQEKRLLLQVIIQKNPIILSIVYARKPNDEHNASYLNQLFESIEQTEQQRLLKSILLNNSVYVFLLDIQWIETGIFDTTYGTPMCKYIWDSLDAEDKVSIMKKALELDTQLFRFIKKDILDSSQYTMAQQRSLLEIVFQQAKQEEGYIDWESLNVTYADQDQIRTCLLNTGENMLRLYTGRANIEDTLRLQEYLSLDELVMIRGVMRDQLNERSVKRTEINASKLPISETKPHPSKGLFQSPENIISPKRNLPTRPLSKKLRHGGSKNRP
ncbi:MAG: hypothetical protein VX112_01890 [Pseudomonadota bacterium]|nr:hypothetical protein [Pseudomonadota bacterium]